MPPRPPVTNTVKLVVNWGGPNATKAANIMYCLMGTGWTPSVANLQSVAQNCYNAIRTPTVPAGATGILAGITNSWTLNSVQAFDNGGTTENQAIYALPHVGGTVGTPLPPNCAAAISWTIPAHYRGGHPRTYIPGFGDGDTAAAGSNNWSSTLRANLAGAASAFLQSFAAGVVAGAAEQLGTIAFKRNNLPLTPPTFYPYTGGSIHQRIDSQRRRLGKENVLA